MRKTVLLVALGLCVACNTGGKNAEAGSESAGGEAVDTSDIEFESEADPNADLSVYKSYGWLAAAGALKDDDGLWQPPNFDIGSEIKFLIDRELRAKGMSESSDAPDVVLAFVLALDIDSQIKELGVNAPLAEGEGGAAELDVPTVGEGGLVVMVVDAKTRNLVWIGAATATLRNGDDNDAKARLDYAVSGLLERFAQ